MSEPTGETAPTTKTVNVLFNIGSFSVTTDMAGGAAVGLLIASLLR